MAVIEQQVAVPPRPRARPAWLDWALSLGFVLVVAPLVILAAIVEGCLFGEIQE